MGNSSSRCGVSTLKLSPEGGTSCFSKIHFTLLPFYEITCFHEPKEILRGLSPLRKKAKSENNIQHLF